MTLHYLHKQWSCLDQGNKTSLKVEELQKCKGKGHDSSRDHEHESINIEFVVLLYISIIIIIIIILKLKRVVLNFDRTESDMRNLTCRFECVTCAFDYSRVKKYILRLSGLRSSDCKNNVLGLNFVCLDKFQWQYRIFGSGTCFIIGLGMYYLFKLMVIFLQKDE